MALAFDDGARLTLSVRAEDRRGPEAVVLSDVPGAPTVVW
jgi:hypothetical protein